MHTPMLRWFATALILTFAPATVVHADGVINIDSCQTVSIPNTVYRLTIDLTSCGDCLVVAADKITIDLHGHSITSSCGRSGAAITDQANFHDVIVVKNGSVSAFNAGVDLRVSTRVSVLGVTATNNADGIVVGPQGLVKSSEASGNNIGIYLSGPRGQVEQCNAHHNGFGITAVFSDNSLITMNTANDNVVFGILVNRCTVSYNTANKNGTFGIVAFGVHNLVTRNVALDNGFLDYQFLECPSDVTYNESTNGFPASYEWFGTGCHFVNNH